MKKITVILSLLICLAVLCSCGGGEVSETTVTAETGTEATTTETTTSTTVATTTTTTAKNEPDIVDESLSKLKAKMAKSVDYFAVAYVGYYEGGYKEVMAELEKSGIIKKYPFIGKISKNEFYALEGNQVYVVVPADDAEVKLHECGFDENGELILIEELTSQNNSKPFIIKGNISDSRPDFQLEAYVADEKMFSYNPVLSMEDGKLYNVNGMLDLTPYDLLPFYG